MHDPDMVLMIEQNVRGGVSFIGERHVRTPNYTKTKDNTSIEDKLQNHLFYIDANNLYSVGQSSPMPFGSYEWCTKEKIEEIEKNINNIDIDSKEGYILEVDMICPPDKHSDLASLPPLPYHKKLTFDKLSPYSQEVLRVLKSEKEAKKYKAKKLVTDVTNKKKYVLHYRMLQMYLKMGLQLKKIHRIIKFEQRRYIKPYIDYCTTQRIKAVESGDSFNALLWKLAMNAVYGKFLQNVTFARTSGNDGDARGLTCFIVPTDAPGFEIGEYWWTFNMPTDHPSCSFKDVWISETDVLGDFDNGLAPALHFVHENRIRQAASSLGAAQYCIDESVKYARERKPFGKPLATNQAIQFPLVELATEAEMLRLLIYKTAAQMDGMPKKDVAKYLSDKVSMCNYRANSLVCRAADRAMQVHGGIGYSRHKPFEHIYRHHRRYRITEGSEEIQMRKIAGVLFGFLGRG